MTIWTHAGIPGAVSPRSREARARHTSTLRFTDRHHAWALTLTVFGLLAVGTLAGWAVGQFMVVVIRLALDHLDATGGASTSQILSLAGSLGGPP